MQSQSTFPDAALDEQRPLADRRTSGVQPMPRIPWSSRISGGVRLRRSASHSSPLLARVVRHVLPRVLTDRARRRGGASRPAGTASPQATQSQLLKRRGQTRSSSATALDVRRVREHVDRPRAHEPVAVLLAQPLGVAGERRRVARDVDDARRGELAEAPQRLARRARRAAGRRRRRRARPRARAGRAAPRRRCRRRTRRCRSRSARRSRSRRRPTPRRSRSPTPSAPARRASRRDRADAAVEVVDGLAAGQRRLLARRCS